MSLKRVDKEEQAAREKQAKAYDSLLEVLEHNQKKPLTDEQKRKLKTDCGFVEPKKCKMIQWSISAGIKLAGEFVCPACGEPAEECLSFTGTACFAHKVT